MHRKSVTLSAALHFAVLLIATLGVPFLPKREFEIPPPIVVDYIEIAKVTETDKVVPVPPAKPDKVEAPTPPPKPQAAKNTANEAVAPVPKEMVKPEEKKVEKPKTVIDENAPVEKDKKKKLVKDDNKPEPQKDFSSVLKNLADAKEKTPVKTEDPDLKLKEMMKSVAGQNAPIGAKLTMSEMDALRAQLERCWNVPFGAKDAEDMRVDIFMVINQDRSLREARIVDTARYSTDAFFRAAADSALRAVRSPMCSPFDLPADKYDTWNTMTVSFNPKDMF